MIINSLGSTISNVKSSPRKCWRIVTFERPRSKSFFFLLQYLKLLRLNKSQIFMSGTIFTFKRFKAIKLFFIIANPLDLEGLQVCWYNQNVRFKSQKCTGK